ncbi:putative serine racemase [Grifola frondosa]|uniref:Serine racemase n=1 Tax=Grifola frondosa TaxID=5627 RepID=A0A1C7M105_GRIFR|nr:putative serine racemase [Grifola frondosa]
MRRCSLHHVHCPGSIVFRKNYFNLLKPAKDSSWRGLCRLHILFIVIFSSRGNTIYFKAENLQKGGAFKFRGASYSLSCLTDDELSKGVCTHSSGNHAGALALAAKERGIKCFVVMPNNSSQPKIDAVRSYGAEITFCEPDARARAATLASVQERTGATFIPPYDAVNTILGQGTALLELQDQVSEPLAVVVAPVGGGGLLAGTALAAEGTGVRVFGAEPVGADDCSRGLAKGVRIEDVQADTIADGLRTPVGVINFPIIQQKVERVIIVSDEEITEAMRLLWERLKLVVEPSGATAFAAVRSQTFQELGIKGPIGVIISGGNVDLSKPLPWL